MRSVVALCLSCVVLATAPPPSRANQDPAPGRITERVVCRNDAGQSYALYLPSGYSGDRAWPIVYAFDASARGLLPVQRFQEPDMERGQFTRAAERLSLMRVVRPDSPGVDFALARAWARAGVKRSALEALRSAVKKGFSDAAAIDADPDLQSLRGEDGYRAIVAGLRKDVR